VIKNLICSLSFCFFQKPSHSDDHGLLHLPPALDIADRSVKLLNTHPTMTNHHHGLGRSIFLKQTRHYYGHQYFRRNSTNNHANASSSRGKGISSHSKQHANVCLMIIFRMHKVNNKILSIVKVSKNSVFMINSVFAF